MSKVEDLLKTARPETEPHIICDSSRKISVPDELRNIAVQYDDNIETVTFDCPRYWDGHDMSEMQVFINYVAPDGTEGQYHCEDVSVDDTNLELMHFSWTILANVTRGYGMIQFLICIKEVDEEGTELRHWNSRICSDMSVLEGLEADPPIPEKYPDVITQILDRLDAIDQNESGGSGGGYVIGSGLKLDRDTNTLSVDTTDTPEQDNTRPISSAGVYTTLGNIDVLLGTI